MLYIHTRLGKSGFLVAPSMCGLIRNTDKFLMGTFVHKRKLRVNTEDHAAGQRANKQGNSGT